VTETSYTNPNRKLCSEGATGSLLRVSGNYLPETLPLALQGPSKIAQGNALGTV